MSNISYYAIGILILHYIKIFFKEFYYTTITTLISSVIFLLILKILTDYYNFKTDNINFMNFVIPGIVMMVVIQATFENISGNIIWMKHHGTFQDILMSPISRIEIAISFLISIWIIGLIIAIINLITINFFVQFNFYNLWRFIYYISLTSIFFGSVGAIVGFISYKWEKQQSFFIFFIAPISMLSGTFFSIDVIDNSWKNIFLLNPFYHLITNVRKSFEYEQIYDFRLDVILIIFVFSMFCFSLYIFKKGYRVID